MRRTPALITAACCGATLLSGIGVAVANAASKPVIKSGYYADIVLKKSAQVTFHLRRNGTQTTDLSLLCTPTNPAWIAGSGDAGIAVVAPLLTVHGGLLTYNGPAIVKPFSAGEKQTGTSTLHLSLHHVDGPVLHYVYEGQHLSQTTAWEGTVSSPGCASVADGGKATLFGPVPGE